jgi:hypothetical protein
MCHCLATDDVVFLNIPYITLYSALNQCLSITAIALKVLKSVPLPRTEKLQIKTIINGVTIRKLSFKSREHAWVFELLKQAKLVYSQDKKPKTEIHTYTCYNSEESCCLLAL